MRRGMCDFTSLKIKKPLHFDNETVFYVVFLFELLNVKDNR